MQNLSILDPDDSHGFDYPRKQSVLVQSQIATVQNRLESGAELLRLQEEFLGMDLSDEDEMI